MVFVIRHPPTYLAERDYIYHVLLREFLGQSYVTQCHEPPEVAVTLVGDVSQKQLLLPDVLFQTPEDQWLTDRSLPHPPLPRWPVPLERLSGAVPVDESVPVVYGACRGTNRLRTVPVHSADSYYAETDRAIRLGIDIFGSSFFMLTRYEEIASTQRDAHDRFPAKASLSFREGCLERPIVNEYVEILWACMKRLWPGLERPERSYQLILTHDVDHPLLAAGRPWRAVVRSAVADLLLRRQPGLWRRRLRARILAGAQADPGNTFDFIMDISEGFGLQSEFYFITDRTGGAIDGNYSLDSDFIRHLMRRIHRRGHALGLHPSYNTYRDARQTRREFQGLLRAAEAEGIQQARWGGRQHFLRWTNPQTWQNWEDAGLNYDSTLGFADHTGFRSGVCYEYPVFNVRTRKRLALRERPLIAMEGTLLSRTYMHLPRRAAVDRIVRLSSICRRFGGSFVLLWHNSELGSDHQKRMYRDVVRSVVAHG